MSRNNLVFTLLVAALAWSGPALPAGGAAPPKISAQAPVLSPQLQSRIADEQPGDEP